MSIIITSLEMPTERERYNLTIKYNGTVLDTETGMQVAEAHELPPHGRLIDADNLLKIVGQATVLNPNFKWIFAALVTGEPTVIPAYEEVYDKYTDTAGNLHWTGTQSGKHIVKAEEGEA